MIITCEHKTDKTAAIEKIDNFLEELKKREWPKKVKIIYSNKEWKYEVMNFVVIFKKGMMQDTVTGEITVSGAQVTLNSELTEFIREMITEEKIKSVIDENFKKLFNL